GAGRRLPPREDTGQSRSHPDGGVSSESLVSAEQPVQPPPPRGPSPEKQHRGRRSAATPGSAASFSPRRPQQVDRTRGRADPMHPADPDTVERELGGAPPLGDQEPPTTFQ